MGTSRISPLCILHNGKCGICQNGLKWPVFPQNGLKWPENGQNGLAKHFSGLKFFDRNQVSFLVPGHVEKRIKFRLLAEMADKY